MHIAIPRTTEMDSQCPLLVRRPWETWNKTPAALRLPTSPVGSTATQAVRRRQQESTGALATLGGYYFQYPLIEASSGRASINAQMDGGFDIALLLAARQELKQ